jgi:hypothetical protein
MLACEACGRAYKARALTPWSLSTATCPRCGGDLAVVAGPASASATPPTARRYVHAATPHDRLSQRVSGLGA